MWWNRPMVLGRQALVGTISCSLVLAGCAGSAALRQKYSVAGDSCEAYREPIYKSQDEFNQQIVESAVIGTLIGVTAGLLLGGNNRGTAALIGGAAGLAAGLGAGYLQAKSSQAKSREELISSINADITRDNGRLDTLGSSLRQLNDCRDQQLNTLLADLQAGRLDKPAARTRLAAVRAAIKNDNALIQEIFGKVDERGTAYVEASAQSRDVEEAMVLGPAKDYQPTLTASRSGYVALQNANVRAAPSTDSTVLGVLQGGEAVAGAKRVQGTDWYSVRYEGRDGYVYRSLIGAPENPSDIQSATRQEVVKASLPADAPPVQRYVTEQAEIKAQQQADQKFLEQKADTIDVLLAV